MRRTSALLFAALLIAGSIACDGGTPADSTEPEVDGACSNNAECQVGLRCEGGFCVDNHCSSSAQCPSGMTCDALSGECAAAPTGPSGPSTGACTAKYDCHATEVCKNGGCVAANASGGCNTDQDCPRGRVCNFSKQCEAGCVDSRDCDGNKLCHPTRFVCEGCSQSNPCPPDGDANAQQCVNSVCQKAATCTKAADCVSAGFDGAVCVNGACANCSTLADCQVAPYKTDQRSCGQDGLCRKVVCNDRDCQDQGGRLAYCDSTTNSCATYDCLNDTDCSAGETCNVSQHRCTGGASGGCSGSALSQCQSTCGLQGLACNPATCTCSGGASGTGTDGSPCVGASDCATGYACSIGICTETVNPSCVTKLGPVMLCSGCTGAATGRTCDDKACMLMGLVTGLLGGGGGASCVSDTDCNMAAGEQCSQGLSGSSCAVPSAPICL